VTVQRLVVAQVVAAALAMAVFHVVTRPDEAE
jgi:hypothetical protein